MKKSNLFRDILKVKIDGVIKYSQGRVYLFVFILAYLAYLIYYMVFPNVLPSQVIIDSLQWAIAVFAVYVFGDKGVKAAKDVLTKKSGSSDTTSTTTKPNEITPADMTSPAINPGGKKEEDLAT